MIEQTCEHCGKQFTTYKSNVERGGGKFCSKKCQDTHFTKSGSPCWKTRIKKECVICGKEYEVKPNDRNHKRCCSKICENKWKSENLLGVDSPNWKEKTTIYCKFCEKTMETTFNVAKTKVFCSRNCSEKWNSLNKTGKNHQNWKEKTIKSCLICGKTLILSPSTADTKFCSIKCRGEYQSKYMIGEKAVHWMGGRKKGQCNYCKKEFYIPRGNAERGYGKYCSLKCRGLAKSCENAPGWKGGIANLPYCYKFNKRRRNAVRIFFKYFCICCGKHVTENIIKRWGQVEHNVHHVDHDKEQGCNGKPFNLVPLCHECHSKEQHYVQEYKSYINKTLEEGFKWGIWSREQYEIEVMYPE